MTRSEIVNQSLRLLASCVIAVKKLLASADPLVSRRGRSLQARPQSGQTRSWDRSVAIATSTRSSVLVTVIAVNMLMTTPMKSVKANPVMIVVPV